MAPNAPSTQFNTVSREHLSRHPSATSSQYPELQTLVKPHIESFNSLTSLLTADPDVNPDAPTLPGLLEYAIADIEPKVVFDGKGVLPGNDIRGKGNKLSIWIEEVTIGKPTISDRDTQSLRRLTYPTECRERLTSYTAKMTAKVAWKVNDSTVHTESRALGQMPIMIRSNRCNLEGLSSKALIARGEEAEEMGGYFINNGIEKIIRLLIVNRRNHVMGIIRPSFQNRGSAYTKYGTIIRCVRPDQTSITVGLHYLSDGQVMFRFHWRKQEYLVPLVLIMKALVDTNDREIFDAVLQGDEGNTFVLDRIELLLRAHRNILGCHTRQQCLAYLGEKFRIVLNLAEDLTNEQIGEALLRKLVLVHLETNREKFQLMSFMLAKLYALVSGVAMADNPDSPQHQEILLGGHLVSAIVKEKLDDWMTTVRQEIQRDVRRNPGVRDFQDVKYVMGILGRVPSDVGRRVQHFLSTGNITSNTGLDLQQTSGYTIVAEKLNFLRYLAHFRCVHRGSFFAELKTTTVRKLLPESWGFLCPVHTPDGSPCGLLNHLAHACQVITYAPNTSRLPGLLAELGVSQNIAPASRAISGGEEDAELNTLMTVQLDGRILGSVRGLAAARMVAGQLREWKVRGLEGVPMDLEVGLVPPSHGGQFPGLYLFSNPARMVRPVRYFGGATPRAIGGPEDQALAKGTPDLVGPFEQVYLDIACMDVDIIPGVTTHQEITPTQILSVVASLTPFSDFNQSPRNMYQCQMGKQAMGTPAQAISRRTDNKLYRIQTGQSPIVRPAMHERFGLDGFPNGFNAVVAVISYTGYDMEDAMILNKSGFERGFGYGSVYKSEIVDLSDYRRRGEPICHFFGTQAQSGDGRSGKRAGGAKGKGKGVEETLDEDGLPRIGVLLSEGDAMCAYIDTVTGEVSVKRYKGMESAYVDEVRVLGNDEGTGALQKIHIKLRIPRPPTIGDKFSSRHGQKGVCSQKWPSVDMPWSESGIQPDVIINPHAFPSRMTIGMFVESLAGKAGALHGCAQDATPFQFSEERTAAAHFGEQLIAAGYNYHGNEPMYSGITGKEMRTDIYLGVVYYQRLRHMVSDKYQVRTTGPVHQLTQQPVKGRKRHGGIRFGEMERDSLLAHGVSFLLQDRLMNCSDYSKADVCRLCGSLVAAFPHPSSALEAKPSMMCRSCGTGNGVDSVAVPFVFRYLAAELMGMGIRMRLDVQ